VPLIALNKNANPHYRSGGDIFCHRLIFFCDKKCHNFYSLLFCASRMDKKITKSLLFESTAIFAV